jgi:hypothetical protein
MMRTRIKVFIEDGNDWCQGEEEQDTCDERLPIEWRKGEVAGKVGLPDRMEYSRDLRNDPDVCLIEHEIGEQTGDEEATFPGGGDDACPTIPPGPRCCSPIESDAIRS